MASLTAAGEHGLVIRHGEQPAAQMVGINPVESFQCTDKRFLQSILRLVMVAEEADKELENGCLVTRQQSVQG
jgi:hypothetical protein